MFSKILAVSTLASAVLVPIATATPAFAGCAPDAGYSFSSVQSIFYRDPQKTITVYPGVTGSITAAAGTSWSGAISGTLKTSVSAFIASVDVSVQTTITYTRTTTVTVGGSYYNNTTSPRWLALGTSGRSMHWSYGYYAATCNYVQQSSGTANLSNDGTPAVAHQ